MLIVSQSLMLSRTLHTAGGLLTAARGQVRAVSLEKLAPSTPKPKRGSYDGVRAGGILKAGWLEKHTNKAPAATAALIEWAAADGGEGALAKVVAEIAATRQHFASRGQARVVIVLVAASPVLEDVEQRYALVVQRASLDPRLASLLVTETDIALRSSPPPSSASC